MRRHGSALLILLVVLGSATASGQPPDAPAPASFQLLAGQVAALFPVVQSEVVEVQGQRVTLAAGRAQGVQPGLELTVVREGRELYHPTTGKLLGRAEEVLGRLVVTEVFDAYAVATFYADPKSPGPPSPGDRARVGEGKVRLAVVTLSSGGRPRVVEAATAELVQELERTGRFHVAFADQVAVWLAQERITPEEFLRGQGLRRAAERFRLAHLLVIHHTTVQGRPFMEVRLFSPGGDAPRLEHALFVPSSVKPAPAQQFSSAPGGGQVRVERRSLLERLLSGDFEPNRYSAGAASIPIRTLATFPFAVLSMDVAVAPHDRVPRIVVTDGQRVYLYRLNSQQVLEPEWTHDKLMVGTILSVQLADLNGDGVLDVVVNRQDAKTGMASYILTTRDRRPVFLAQDIPLILLAMDEQGEGLNKVLWGQRYNPETVWVRGAVSRYALKGTELVPTSRVLSHDAFRATGATFANITGAKERVLAFVDEQGRLTITNSVGHELWRSSMTVGGGLVTAQVKLTQLGTIVEKSFRIEPQPLAVDLDGDGVQEIVVPVNQGEAGRLAVVFRGPAGFRIQVVNSGFEGMVTGLGAIPNADGTVPSLVAAVVQRRGLVLRSSGETHLLMTVPE